MVVGDYWAGTGKPLKLNFTANSNKTHAVRLFSLTLSFYEIAIILSDCFFVVVGARRKRLIDNTNTQKKTYTKHTGAFPLCAPFVRNHHHQHHHPLLPIIPLETFCQYIETMVLRAPDEDGCPEWEWICVCVACCAPRVV